MVLCFSLSVNWFFYQCLSIFLHALSSFSSFLYKRSCAPGLKMYLKKSHST
ncbi:hypothetical protein Scep_002093 [Stephania cephalantha]|uniref:Uncharacterized protein n=1 Tax=Stephania cephalantha TaxID=152367 RepID=A0AAP0L9B3_9MAGN